MRPPTVSQPYRVAVIGGGIAGLAAANRLLELAAARGIPVALTLLEARARLGGTIATERTDGFVIEGGPDSFISEKPWALDLCRRLGLGPALIGTRDEHRRTFVVRDGSLQPLPEGFLLLAPTRFWPFVVSPLFSWSGKLRMAPDLVLPRGRATDDESLGSFVGRRLGREALERVAQPLVSGIYTADPDRLSLAATMPRFLEMERRHRSVILGMLHQPARRPAVAGPATGGGGEESGARWSLFVSLDDGMQRLVDAITARLPRNAARVGATVTTIAPGAAAGEWRVVLADGDVLEADAVVLATPAHVAAALTRDLDPLLASELAGIPYASSATVTLAYRRADVPHQLDGFGFVVPLVEGRRIIACTFSSVKYPGRAPADAVLLRSFAGGALQASMSTLDDSNLEAAVRSELAALLGISAPPILVRVHRHPDAMPQYHVGHLARVARIEERLARHHPGLAVAGNAYRGVGIPDCVRSGEAAAETALAVITPVPQPSPPPA